MNADVFFQNLGTLCSYYPSIAEVCRKLGINRQQFNKYLNGQSRPSRHNMRRICDYFGVTESEMLLDPQRFEDILSLRQRSVAESPLALPMRHVEMLWAESVPLDRYLGYYFRYSYSFGRPGYINRSLSVLYERDGLYLWKDMELARNLDGQKKLAVAKFIGIAFMIAERIFVIEYNQLLKNSITQMTLYPSYRSRVEYLIGIQTGGPVRRGRKPGANRVLLEYLGRQIDVKNALAQSDMFRDDDPRIKSEIVEMIRNDVPSGSYVLEVDEV